MAIRPRPHVCDHNGALSAMRVVYRPVDRRCRFVEARGRRARSCRRSRSIRRSTLGRTCSASTARQATFTPPSSPTSPGRPCSASSASIVERRHALPCRSSNRADRIGVSRPSPVLSLFPRALAFSNVSNKLYTLKYMRTSQLNIRGLAPSISTVHHLQQLSAVAHIPLGHLTI